VLDDGFIWPTVWASLRTEIVSTSPIQPQGSSSFTTTMFRVVLPATVAFLSRFRRTKVSRRTCGRCGGLCLVRAVVRRLHCSLRPHRETDAARPDSRKADVLADFRRERSYRHLVTSASQSEPMPIMPPGYDPASGTFGGALYHLNLGITGLPQHLPTSASAVDASAHGRMKIRELQKKGDNEDG